jgi:ferrochelatase
LIATLSVMPWTQASRVARCEGIFEGLVASYPTDTRWQRPLARPAIDPSRSLVGALAILYLGVMNKSPRAKDFEAKPAPAGTGKIGVLLINLGTPDATTYWPMRRYLKEFLSDRRVIETNRALWWAILNGVVLVKRPVSSGAKYRSIWNEALDESPLRTITRAQAEKVAAAFAGRPGIVVDWAMRYGNPSIHERIDALVAQGCDRIVSFPLYPQYAAATTATANDKVFEALTKLRAQPALRTVPPYPADPVYIEALADSIRTHLAGLDFAPEAILASFHGLPQDYVDKGDPYQAQCVQTTEALRAALGPELGAKLKLTFQSRFGRAEWIKPYTDKTVEALARDGVKSIAIVTPGFAADCVETLEEIADENREIFLEHGGERFAYIPCLNDSAGGIAVLVHLIERELQGWA